VAEHRENDACDGCSRSVVPLVETSDGRALCIACIEADPNNEGVEQQAVWMLRVLSRQAQGLAVLRAQALRAKKLN
jgi:hypothetical protein